MCKNVILAKNAGFCFGVQRAVDEAIKAQEIYKTKIYTLGPLIHNDHAVNFLKSKGIYPISLGEIENLTQGEVIIIRSHGIPKNIYGTLKEKNLTIIDATCPFVSKIHKIAEKYYEQGYQIIVVGDENHPEVIGIDGWCDNTSIIFKGNEFSKPITKKACLLCQTTEKQENFERAVQILSKECKEFIVFNTICSATKERQFSATELSKKVDIMIVLGDKNSSNTSKLYEICSKNCSCTIHVESSEEIPQKFVLDNSIKTIGITAGASTPDWIIKEALYKMNNENNINMDEMSMNDVINYMNENDQKIYVGQKIEGIIVSINKDGVYLNINYKREGVIPTSEISNDELSHCAVGDKLDAKVIQRRNENENVVLSRIEVQKENSLKELKEMFENEQVIKVTIKKEIKGGLMAEYKGISTFLPASLVELYHVNDLSKYEGKDLEVKIVELSENRRQTKIVVSRKAILVEEKEKIDKAAWDNFKVDDIYDGIVKRISSFGAFVEVNGVDGLLHVSEIGWGKINNPKDVLKIGETIKVKIIDMDIETKRLSLSIKSLIEDPWKDIEIKYPEGNIALGKVVRFASFGAFIQLEPGVDGLVHISQISHDKIEKPEDVLSIGENVKVKIIKVDIDNKRISLSIKATE